jgi:hypothetical protein
VADSADTIACLTAAVYLLVLVVGQPGLCFAQGTPQQQPDDTTAAEEPQKSSSSSSSSSGGSSGSAGCSSWPVPTAVALHSSPAVLMGQLVEAGLRLCNGTAAYRDILRRSTAVIFQEPPEGASGTATV